VYFLKPERDYFFPAFLMALLPIWGVFPSQYLLAALRRDKGGMQIQRSRRFGLSSRFNSLKVFYRPLSGTELF